VHCRGLWNLIVGFALLGSTACATVGGTRQAVSFDSSPRGLNVAVNSYLTDSDEKTPFTDEISRSSSLEILYHSGDFVKKKSVECNFRFGTVLLGNAALGALSLQNPPLALFLFLGGIGTDLATRSAFDCPQMVKHAIELPEAVEADIHQKCNKVLVLPPKLDDEDLSLSYALISEAQEFVKRFDKECPSFVSPSATASALKRSSVDDGVFSELFAGRMEKKLVQIVRDSGANRGVDMQIARKSQGEIEVVFALRDLYSKTEIANFKKVFTSQKIEKLKGGWISRYLGKSLRLVPNSFALLTTQPNLTLTTKLATVDQPIKRESFIGMLSLTSVQHPDQYDPWDMAFDFGPSVFFDSIRNRISFDEKDEAAQAFVKDNPEAAKSTDFTGYALSIPVDAILSFHTPAGAFRLFGGGGLGLFKSTSSEPVSKKLQAFPAVHLGLDWVGYATKNIFFQVGYHGIASLSDRALEQRQFHGFEGWASVTFGAGYFFPDTQGYLESMFAGNQ